jgi:hypothetical protein
MPKRMTLGTTYTNFPAKKLSVWLSDNLVSVIGSSVVSVIWVGIYALGLNICNFLNVEILKNPPWDTAQIFRSDMSFMIMSAGIILITIYVFKQNSGRGKKQRKGYH